MALTPDDVVTKQFQHVRFKEGFDPDEVDDFLDEIVVECDAGDAEAARDWLVGCMTAGMQRFLPRVPVAVEATIARDWSGSPLRTEQDDAA